MADGYRVVAKAQISGRRYSIEAAVTLQQMADPATRDKIRRWMKHQLIEGILQQYGGVEFEVNRSLDVTGFQPDEVATGRVSEDEAKPPTPLV